MPSPQLLSRRNLLWGLSLLRRGRLRAQQQPTFSADVRVVNVFATVRDQHRRIVGDLKRSDFLLNEEGVQQEIRFFSAESDLPLTLGLLIDSSGSQQAVFADESAASYRFFDRILREDRDVALVVAFATDVELLQDLTSSRQKLEKALRQLDGGGATKLYDAVRSACDESMQPRQGRKALVVLTNGVDNGSKSTVLEAIESAQRADTLVYSVLYTGMQPAAPSRIPTYTRRTSAPSLPRPRRAVHPSYSRGASVMQRIAQETGGAFFEVRPNLPIDKIFASIEEELRNQYSIGYSPEQHTPDGAYRHIELSVTRHGMVVQTRGGYYPH